MTALLTLYFVRHGEVHNPDEILYGRLPDFHLSTIGRGQASAAARYLADKPIVAVYTSPMERAQETAAIIESAHLEFSDVFIDERLNEVHCPYDGTTIEDLEKIHFDLYSGSPPAYEQPRDIRRRVLDFIADIRQQYANQAIAAVSHGDIMVSMFMFAHRADENDIGRSRHEEHRNRLQEMGLPDEYPATASLSRLTFMTDDPERS
ncbi:MAG: histidine phosphatase family protein, partial [Anaerolineae bacterium]|nr:histidine phosphatase family protein [Anaerolineae bacterium]